MNPIQFLDLPFELRSQIVEQSIGGNPLRPSPRSGGFRTGDEIQPYDFTIDAAGLNCHFLKSLNLLSVNRQIRRESMAIILQQTLVCIEVEIPRYGGLSKVNGSVPGVLGALNANALLCEMAQKVTVIFRPESAVISGPLVKVNGGMVPFIRENLGLRC